MDSETGRTAPAHIDREQLKAELILSSVRMKKIVKNLLCGGITQREFFVLEVLNTKGLKYGNGMYVSVLADTIHVSTPQASRMLKNMEEKGYIRREIDEKNRRNTFVYATEKGKEARIKAQQEMDAFADRVIIRMGVDNVKKLIELFNMSTDIVEDELIKRKDNPNV